MTCTCCSEQRPVDLRVHQAAADQSRQPRSPTTSRNELPALLRQTSIHPLVAHVSRSALMLAVFRRPRWRLDNRKLPWKWRALAGELLPCCLEHFTHAIGYMSDGSRWRALQAASPNNNARYSTNGRLSASTAGHMTVTLLGQPLGNGSLAPIITGIARAVLHLRLACSALEAPVSA